MITSKQIIKLSEEWFKNVTGYMGKPVPLFINPNSSDLKELFNSSKGSKFGNLIRFVADAKTQNVYVGDGGLVIHNDILKSISLNSSVNFDTLPNIFMGYGILKQGKIYFEFNGNSSSNGFDPIERVTSMLNKLESSMFRITSSSNKNDKLIEMTKRKREWLLSFFRFNWSFLNRYVIGTGPFLEKEKARFSEWKSKYEKILLEL